MASTSGNSIVWINKTALHRAPKLDFSCLKESGEWWRHSVSPRESCTWQYLSQHHTSNKQDPHDWAMTHSPPGVCLSRHRIAGGMPGACWPGLCTQGDSGASVANST